MNKNEQKTAILEALGEASMSWSESPKGQFDSANCERIGNELIENLSKRNKIGTIEPIYKVNDNDNIAFIRGAIVKYRDSDIEPTELYNYVLKQLEIQNQ